MRKILQKIRETRTAIGQRFDFVARTFEGRTTTHATREAVIRRRKVFAHYLYNFVFSSLAALTLSQTEPEPMQFFDLNPGDISPETVISPLTTDLEPLALAKSTESEIEANVAPVFDYDDNSTENWLSRWVVAIRRIRAENYAKGKKPPTVDTVIGRLQALTGQTISSEEAQHLHQAKFSEQMEQEFTESGRLVLGKIISSSNLFPTYSNTGITMRLVNRAMREINVYDVTRVWSLEQAKDYVLRGSREKRSAKGGVLTTDIVAEHLQPNLRYNENLTRRRVAKAVTSARAVPTKLKKGQILIHKGERVSEEQSQILRKLKDITSNGSSLKKFFLSLLLLFVFFSVLFRLNITGRAFWNLSLKDAVVFLVITLVSFAGAKYALPSLRVMFSHLNMGFGVEYLLPISAGGIIIHLMMGKETAFTYATLTSIVVGYVLDQNFYFTVYCFAVSAAAIQSIRSCKQRTDLYRCGAWSGLVGALLVLCFSLTQAVGIRSLDWFGLLLALGLSFGSGMLSAVLTSTLIPVFESVFGYTTSLKLLELSNFNHPLLHNLMMKAPGTYHHSVIVGSLAELAADRIKANSLLARVSAYYHDIGKMAKPLYFIENQVPNDNPHDHLQPSMSAKILFAHVKDGARMGREHALGDSIVNIIEQHHGTTLIAYFFNKAKKAENPDLDHVEESQFRYPGPKPQTREAAIVMLADACEAATRSIAEPTASKIQNMVHNIINKRFMEEQFSECDLTLRDLKIVEDCFVRTLVSLYHHRIEYPGQKQAFQPAGVPDPVNPSKKAHGGQSG